MSDREPAAGLTGAERARATERRAALADRYLPGLDLGPYAEGLGGPHHLAISVERARWERLRDNLAAAESEVHEAEARRRSTR